MVRRLEPQHQQRARPPEAPVIAASRGSSSRQFDGYRPLCESARTASAPAAKSANVTPADALKRGPVLQAHPRLGDHAEDALRAEQHPVGARAGARARAGAGSRTSPVGVTARTDSTRSSMCV